MRRSFAPFALLLVASSAHAGTCDFSGVVARVDQLADAAGLADAGVAIGTTHGLLLEHYRGAYDGNRRVPLASASKLLSGVRIVELVDHGRIALDTPVSTYLPAFTGLKGTMTTRQMFSHTAGYGDDLASPILGANTITLSQAVAYVACCVDQTFPPPGEWFAYGGLSMHVAGEVAQVRGGVDWEQGWSAAIGTPLGITSIDWQGLGPTQNYRISGGAQATMPDYARVLAMLLGNGVGNGRRVLSPGAVATLNHDQTGTAALGYAPPTAAGSHAYGIGAWIETSSASAEAPTISSIGAFGYTPWVDFDRGYFGILMIEDHAGGAPSIGQRAHDAMLDIAAVVASALDTRCVPVAPYDMIFNDGG